MKALSKNPPHCCFGFQIDKYSAKHKTFGLKHPFRGEFPKKYPITVMSVKLPIIDIWVDGYLSLEFLPHFFSYCCTEIANYLAYSRRLVPRTIFVGKLTKTNNFSSILWMKLPKMWFIVDLRYNGSLLLEIIPELLQVVVRIPFYDIVGHPIMTGILYLVR
ncbi:hypothetical protein M0813_26514 [Anaeramoeba flamelloides]|uniref:Uncharacterized protein n=1 Tax=Anaeramoeba flamelloides TaxID=1746091 RepID=A0ABQ8Y0Z2_9EUKA|nr:hypothetical protein M0813_26514 [Anaeramoeba flamelloides]